MTMYANSRQQSNSTSHSARNRASRFLVSLCLSGGMLLTCSCVGSIGGKTASNDPFLKHGEPTSASPSTPATPQPVRVAAAMPTMPHADGIAPVSHVQTPATGVVQLAEWSLPPAEFGRPQRVEPAVYATPATARVDIAQVAHQQPAGPPNRLHARDVDQFTDEYLLDGGDRDLPIHYDRFNRLGVDTEDTIVEYQDHLGDDHVKPTNRVAVYAPRFGAVRHISGPDAGTQIALIARADKTSRSSGLRNRRTPLDRTQHGAAGRIDVRSRPSGVEGGASGRGVQQSTVLVLNVQPVKATEGLSFVGTGRFLQTERARLATGIQAAAVWSRTQSPVITAQADGLKQLYSFFNPEELVGLSDDHLKKGELRIVKLADRKTAKPGDIITFTIRYDNLGDRELNNIRIIDNLTPRLEYVEDSATSDRAGRLDVEDNGEGSLVLKFIVDDPLKGHQGGVVTFKALVR